MKGTKQAAELKEYVLLTKKQSKEQIPKILAIKEVRINGNKKQECKEESKVAN